MQVGKVQSALLAEAPLEGAAKATDVLAYEPPDTSVPDAAPSNGASASSADCTFPTCTSTWGTVSHIGIFDASTSGNLLYHTPLDTSKTIETGDIFKIASGSLTVTLD